MEIDIREIPEGERLSRVLSAFSELGRTELLSLLSTEDPRDLAESITNVLGDSVDIQRTRWGTKDLGWMMHVKRSLSSSAYQPDL